MRTVRGRLVAHYLVLIALGIALVWAGTYWATRNTFESYVGNQHVAREYALVPSLEQYWADRGSWTGVQSILRAGAGPGGRGLGRRGMGMGGPGTGAGGVPPYRGVLADATGNIVFDGYPQAGPIPQEAWEDAVDVVVDGAKVGAFLVTGTAEGALGILEEEFLSRIRLALAFIAFLSLAIGLLLSLRFAREISKPIEMLSRASTDLAERKFGGKVDLEAKDPPLEVRKLVDSFNSMSSELAEAETRRREMLRDISHEIRTPLTILSGTLEAVSAGAIELDADTLATMSGEIDRLGGLVKNLDLLDHAVKPGEAGARRVAAREIVERAASSVQGAAAARRILIEREAAENLPQVMVDPDRVQQVLSNILSNALRYTPEGGTISIGASLEERDGVGADAVVIRVADSGLGIPEDQLSRVFERFFRGDLSRSRATGGSGLGLAIAKSLVEGWDGRIWAENRPEGGAVFSFTVPPAPKGTR